MIFITISLTFFEMADEIFENFTALRMISNQRPAIRHKSFCFIELSAFVVIFRYKMMQKDVVNNIFSHVPWRWNGWIVIINLIYKDTLCNYQVISLYEVLVELHISAQKQTLFIKTHQYLQRNCSGFELAPYSKGWLHFKNAWRDVR